MPLDETDAQTALKKELADMADRLRELLVSELLLSLRYSLPAHHVAQALSCLVDSEIAVEDVQRVND